MLIALMQSFLGIHLLGVVGGGGGRPGGAAAVILVVIGAVAIVIFAVTVTALRIGRGRKS